jgi:hypothetical protein
VARGDASIAATGAIPSPQWVHIVGSNTVAQIPNGGTANFTAPHADTRHLTFNASGNLLIGTDGGVFLRSSPQTNTGDWSSLNGNLGDLEIHDIDFDEVAGGVFFGGTQDNGTVMQDFPNEAKWNTSHTGDGGDVAVAIDNTVPGQSIRYMSQQNLGSFKREVFVNNVLQSTVPIVPLVSGPAFPINIYQIEGTLPFITRFAVNRNNGQRLVIGGTTTVYESFDHGDHVTPLGVAPNAAELDYGHPNSVEALWAAVPQFVAPPNPPNPNADIYHRITGDLTLRRANPTFPGTVDPGGAQDVVMSATSERTAYAITGTRVFRDVVAANGTSTWTDITGDLQQQTPGFLRQVKFVASATQDRLIVAGDQGVFMGTLNPPGFWSRVGTNLPRVVSFDLNYSQASDQLAVGTMGRGAWTFANISTNNMPPAVICQSPSLVANASCQGILSFPGINNGSIDPEGQSLTCTQSPQSPFPVGITTVTLSCTDPAGSTNQCTGTVTVIDQTKPTLTPPPDITITTCVNPNLGTPAVADNCGVSSVSNNAPAKFPLGTTIVTWTAIDSSGNFQLATQKVTAILGDDSSCCPSGTNIIVGTAGTDNLVGTAGSDCILGLGGDDLIDARDGDDFVSGGAGNDTITGGNGNNFVFGGAGNDTLQGGTGDDFIAGGTGSDNCSGGTGLNTIIECESTSFCTAACCNSMTCVVPNPPAPDTCRPAFAQANCFNYGQGTIVSSGGHNWQCANGNCANCAASASCFPGAAGCPWGTVWTDLGVCH